MATKLEPGMLLLDPGESINGNPPRPSIQVVQSPKVLIQHLTDISVKSTLRKSELPKGWRVVNNRALAKYLIDNEEDLLAGVSV